MPPLARLAPRLLECLLALLLPRTWSRLVLGSRLGLGRGLVAVLGLGPGLWSGLGLGSGVRVRVRAWVRCRV